MLWQLLDVTTDRLPLLGLSPSLTFSLPGHSLPGTATSQCLLLLISGNSVIRRQGCVRDFLCDTSGGIRAFDKEELGGGLLGVFSH